MRRSGFIWKRAFIMKGTKLLKTSKIFSKYSRNFSEWAMASWTRSFVSISPKRLEKILVLVNLLRPASRAYAKKDKMSPYESP